MINNKGNNSGVVARCDKGFGKVIEDNYTWNHFDEMKHFLGIRSLCSANPVRVYRQYANRLKTKDYKI